MLADYDVIFNVVEQALIPGMALRACQLHEGDIHKVSRLISAAVAERAAAEVAAERSINSIGDVVIMRDTSSGSKKKRSRTDEISATMPSNAASMDGGDGVPDLTPILPPSTAPALAALDAENHPSTLHEQFTAPYLLYLKNGSHLRTTG